MAHSGYFTFEYPYYQRFIFDDFVRSDICFYGALHSFTLVCAAEAVGISVGLLTSCLT